MNKQIFIKMCKTTFRDYDNIIPVIWYRGGYKEKPSHDKAGIFEGQGRFYTLQIKQMKYVRQAVTDTPPERKISALPTCSLHWREWYDIIFNEMHHNSPPDPAVMAQQRNAARMIRRYLRKTDKEKCGGRGRERIRSTQVLLSIKVNGWRAALRRRNERKYAEQ